MLPLAATLSHAHTLPDMHFKALTCSHSLRLQLSGMILFMPSHPHPLKASYPHSLSHAPSTSQSLSNATFILSGAAILADCHMHFQALSQGLALSQSLSHPHRHSQTLNHTLLCTRVSKVSYSCPTAHPLIAPPSMCRGADFSPPHAHS